MGSSLWIHTKCHVGQEDLGGQDQEDQGDQEDQEEALEVDQGVKEEDLEEDLEVDQEDQESALVPEDPGVHLAKFYHYSSYNTV